MSLLKRFQSICNSRVERIFQNFLYLDPQQKEFSEWQAALYYSLLGGGKRIRAMLCIATGMIYEIPETELDIYAAAIEMIHAFSLIHDDLPAMDNDNLRRGKPTAHITFGEANAILAGDALNTAAFELLAGIITPHFNSLKRLKMIKALCTASGFKGMCAGQYLDVNPDKNTPTLEGLRHLHQLKTGKLIEACITLPLIYAEPAENEAQALTEFASLFGLIFQIQDDILDIEGQAKTLGKTPLKDQHLNKFTYPAILGLEAAKNHRADLYSHAQKLLQPFGERAEFLSLLLEFAAKRDY
jgi:geranylgeranyl pyrophosphate synthase